MKHRLATFLSLGLCTVMLVFTGNVNGQGNLSDKKSFKPFYPAGNKAFVLYYGSNLNEVERIRKTSPNFVIVGFFTKKAGGPTDVATAAKFRCVLNGGTAKECENVTGPTQNKSGIRTLYYISNHCGTDSPECTEKERNNKLNPGIDSIKRQVTDVIEKLDYDGIFFDTTGKPDAEKDRYTAMAALVKSFSNKLVIVNPGMTDSNICSMFEYADIVSVENKWNAEISKICTGKAIESWRWLSVQGDSSGETGIDMKPPPDLTTALVRLKTFRKKGGYWYYGPSKDHEHLPEYLEGFIAKAK